MGHCFHGTDMLHQLAQLYLDEDAAILLAFHGCPVTSSNVELWYMLI